MLTSLIGKSDSGPLNECDVICFFFVFWFFWFFCLVVFGKRTANRANRVVITQAARMSTESKKLLK